MNILFLLEKLEASCLQMRHSRTLKRAALFVLPLLALFQASFVSHSPFMRSIYRELLGNSKTWNTRIYTMYHQGTCKNMLMSSVLDITIEIIAICLTYWENKQFCEYFTIWKNIHINRNMFLALYRKYYYSIVVSIY